MEARIDSWRPLLQAGQPLRVIDSCQIFIAQLPNGQYPRQKALAISLQASATNVIGQSEKALTLQSEALALRKQFLGNQHQETANSYQNMGNCLFVLGRTEEAGMAFKKALAIKTQLFPKQSPSLIRIYNSMGQYYLATFSFSEARYYLELALAIAEKTYGSEHPQIIARLIALADLHTAENRHDTALSLLQRANQILVNESSEDYATQVMLYKNMGNAYAAKGAYTEGLQWLNTALRKSNQFPDIAANTRADLLYNIGTILLDQGDFSAAEFTLKSALSSHPASLSAHADVLNALGLALRYKGQSGAIDTLVVAGNLYLRTAVNPVNQQSVAGIWQNVGNCHLDLGEQQAALYYFEKALNHLKGVPGSQLLQMACMDKIGLCHLAIGDLTTASDIWEKLLSSKLRLPVPLAFSIQYHVGEFHLKEKKWALATSDFEKALAMLGSPGPSLAKPFPYEYVQAISALASTWQQKAQQTGDPADWNKSLNWARQAIDALQDLKAQLRSGRSAIELQQIFDTPFDIAIRACVELEDPESAWYYAELFKNTFLQKLRWQSGMRANFQLPPNWIKNDVDWNSALAYYQRLQSTINALDPDQKNAINDSIQRISERLYTLRQDISRQYPEVYQYLYKPAIPALQALQKNLNAAQSILEYHWASSELIYAFVIRADTFLCQALPVNGRTEADIVDFFQHCAQNPYQLPDEIRTAYCAELLDLGEALYQQLAMPLEPVLTQEVLIVPDAMLCLLPFEALIMHRATAAYRMDQHQYWLQQHHVSYANSAASWMDTHSAKRAPGREPLLVVAPDFKLNTHGLSPLQYNQPEAEAVCDITSGTALLGLSAQKTAFLEKAPRFSAMHLATHGVMDDREPLASYIAFTAIPGDQTSTDNLLYVSDIYNSHFPTELIVLSACQTASGQLYRGEGLLSIAQAFQFAGAQSLVASLWNVDDKRTPELMASFFKKLWQKQAKNLALSEAKQQYIQIQKGLDAHPYFWSGLLLSGNVHPLSQTGNWPYWAYGLVVLCLGLAAYFFYKRLEIN